jgi:ABC-type multidrug transport system fused ATPase/permease subunit
MQGEKIAIVGESGSGKTTLARLMLRFYTPESGTIYADEQSIQEINLNDLRRKIAYVSQNTFFFADTIMENLKLGTPDATYDEVIAICKKCHADEFIREMPFGYETPINENGANLSGGQRQRLAIAQALLQKPQLLILDEATSNLDTITEALIRNTIFSLDNTLTVIMIAHRLQTVKHCDRILVMEKGTILEQGTHDELYRMNGKYTELWSMQQ